ncbi:hypothetical protein B4073_4237 [Bacillus subtilis]|nr:hypothetical protein B4073_4237 [Bacillus subtilis]
MDPVERKPMKLLILKNVYGLWTNSLIEKKSTTLLLQSTLMEH